MRGRAFAFNQAIQLSAIPVVAFLAWLFVPHAPLGFDGWRWVVLIGSFGAGVVWWIRLRVPESPRWLADNGHAAEAERVMGAVRERTRARFPQSSPKRLSSRRADVSGRSGARPISRARSC